MTRLPEWVSSWWKPIKSVPKNGKAVLLYDEEWELTLGSIQIGHAEGDGFVVPETGDFNPTHWMPLPPEPPH